MRLVQINDRTGTLIKNILEIYKNDRSFKKLLNNGYLIINRLRDWPAQDKAWPACNWIFKGLLARHGKKFNKSPGSFRIVVLFFCCFRIPVHFFSSLRIPVHFSGSFRIPVHIFGSFRIPVLFFGSFKIPPPFLRMLTYSTKIFLRILLDTSISSYLLDHNIHDA